MHRFALTVFVSAFLLFQVQPLIGRFILPWFGGGPSIWTSCMLFFQVLLLCGYLYAHLIGTKLRLRGQVITHLILLAVSLAFLPIAPGDSWKPSSDHSPLLQILVLLSATVGAPYFMLSSTGPLMQKWFSLSSPGKAPYRLYALSNAGSLLALLSYPFFIEPWLTLKQQVWSWSVVYGLYVLMVYWCSRLLRRIELRSDQAEIKDPASGETLLSDSEATGLICRPSAGLMLLWVGLAACGSAMLLATTNQLCIDVATVPFLWVLPLSLYLISFIICFDSPRWYDRRAFGLLLLVITPVACWVISEGADVNISRQVAIYSAVLFACCMTCHGELVSCKPHPKYLTLFYVLVSAGGAIGGVFVAVVAPYAFHGYWEYHIGLVACCAMVLLAWYAQRIWLREPSPEFWIWAVAVALQMAVSWYVVYLPVSSKLQMSTGTFVFGVYGILQFIGLVVAGTLDGRRLATVAAWCVFLALSVGWLIGYGLWQFPDLMTPTILYATIGTAIASLLVAAGCLWLSDLPEDSSRRLWVRGVLFVVAAGLCGWLLYSGEIDQWQALVFGFTAVAGLMMEWSARGFRGPVKPSLGFWFWVPSVTLILFLANQLAEIVASGDSDSESTKTVYTLRNFYGLLRVRHTAAREDDEHFVPPKFSLTHGQIQHGFQFIDDYWKRQPTTYYGRSSGIGLAIEVSRECAQETDGHSLRVGIVGLGTGTIAAYGEEGDYFRFYDINPDVKKLSDTFFTYLTDSAAMTKIVPGDARIQMERETAKGDSQQFDVLAIDAFSSDAIPVHLLTLECADIYRQQLRPDGILAVHISNRFLDLDPVTRGIAEHLGWEIFRIENGSEELSGVFSSTWMLLTPRKDLGENLEISAACEALTGDERILHWTDDYSGLWQVLTY